MFILRVALCVVCTCFLIECRFDNAPSRWTLQQRNDSTEIHQLMSAVLRWRQEQQNKAPDGFPYKLEHPGDSLFTGIDWDKFAKSQSALKSTQLFATEFLENMQAIADKIDSCISKSGPADRIYAMVSLFEPEGDHWCDCFEYPPGDQGKIQLGGLHTDGTNASFTWTWGGYDNQHKARARKESGRWKISYLDGFDISSFGVQEFAKGPG